MESKLFFASKNSSVLQRFLPKHQWGIQYIDSTKERFSYMNADRESCPWQRTPLYSYHLRPWSCSTACGCMLDLSPTTWNPPNLTLFARWVLY